MVVLAGEGLNARGVITAIVARLRKLGRRKSLRFIGPGHFEAGVQEQCSDVLLPLVTDITGLLRLPQPSFDISIANVGAAATAEVGLQVRGYSAGVPLLLAMLSASLRMPLPEDLLSTGHVASADGDIAPVKGIPAKLRAALADPSIRTFVHPAIERDGSFEVLTPNEAALVVETLILAKDQIRTAPVSSVAELIRLVFDDRALTLSALKCGYYSMPAPRSSPPSILSEAVEFMLARPEDRFWSTLERAAIGRQFVVVRELLAARADYELARRRYPTGLGNRLLGLVRSLPPATRRARDLFPLLPGETCIRLSQHAGKNDYEDVRLLLGAAAGRSTRHIAGQSTRGRGRATRPPGSSPATLDAILGEINAEALSQQIGLPVDAARAAYAVDRVTADCYEEFIEAVSSFFLHVLRHTRCIPAPVGADAVTADALDLLARAFERDGGVEAAWAEARDATHGGLRRVFDALADRYKAEEQAKRVNLVLKEALDPLDWPARVSLMAALLERLRPHLSADVAALPPARLARQHELVTRAYVRSLDQVRRTLRSL